MSRVLRDPGSFSNFEVPAWALAVLHGRSSEIVPPMGAAASSSLSGLPRLSDGTLAALRQLPEAAQAELARGPPSLSEGTRTAIQQLPEALLRRVELLPRGVGA